MLVLSRKKNESVIINDDIVITIVEIRTDKVRLGIQTPKGGSVHRQEVHELISREENPRNLPWPGIPDRDSGRGDVLARLTEKLNETAGNSVSRELVSIAILEAVEAIEDSLQCATSLDDLKQLLIRRRH